MVVYYWVKLGDRDYALYLWLCLVFVAAKALSLVVVLRLLIEVASRLAERRLQEHGF